LSKLHGAKAEFGLKDMTSNGNSLRVKCFKYFKNLKRHQIVEYSKECEDFNMRVTDFQKLAKDIKSTISLPYMQTLPLLPPSNI